MDSFLAAQKADWNRSALEHSSRREQVHCTRAEDGVYESLYEELEYYLELRESPVLEVGCGNGLLLEQIARVNHCVHGVDLSDRLIERGREALPELADRLQVADACALPFAAETFGAVVSNSVFQYFPDMDYAMNAAREMLRVCRPGGRVFISDIYNRRLKAWYDRANLPRGWKARARRFAGACLRRLGMRSSRFEYLYIEPDTFLDRFRSDGKVWPLLITSRKPELFRIFRYSILIEKKE